MCRKHVFQNLCTYLGIFDTGRKNTKATKYSFLVSACLNYGSLCPFVVSQHIFLSSQTKYKRKVYVCKKLLMVELLRALGRLHVKPY